MKSPQNKINETKKDASSLSKLNKDLETQMPLSEKDEVKKAERKTSKAIKK